MGAAADSVGDGFIARVDVLVGEVADFVGEGGGRTFGRVGEA